MATKKTEVVEIKPLEIKKINVTLIGDTPLIMHKWSEKAKKEMLDAQQGKSKGKKKRAKNPVADFIASMYWLDGSEPEITDDMSEEDCERAFLTAIENGARFGFPATAFKKAAISAAYRMGWSKDKVSLQGAFFIDADEGELVEIKSDAPIMREDPVKIGMGTSDLRYRGEFDNWRADITLTYNANGQYSLDNILTMLNAGGYTCGVGEWRTEKGGQNGMFHIGTN